MADTTPTLREAAQQFVQDYENGDLGDLKHYARSMRAALAEQAAEQAEPVAWQWLDTSTFRKRLPSNAEPGAWRPLYAAHCIVGFAKDKPGRMCGWLDDACSAADTAAEMFSGILAAPPAPARQEPLTESQVDDLIHSKHFDRSYKLHASDETCLRWYRLGLRDGERAHGIVAAPAEGGAA